MTDPSNGYQSAANEYLAARESRATGADIVLAWATARVDAGGAILDLGCGSGIPISQALMDHGFTVYGVDASPAMVEAFRSRFPDSAIECAAVQESNFFDRKFDAVVAWGLVFLLDPAAQRLLIQKMAHALRPDGSLLFTAPTQVCNWHDVLTGGMSTSLGIDEYRRILALEGCDLDAKRLVDEGGNHYYSASKRSL